MTRAARSVLLVVVLLSASELIQAQSAACQHVQFSPAVLARFPNAQASCLDVITRDGEQYAVFKAQLADVRGNTVRLRVKNPDGTYGEWTSFTAKPGRKVLIDGKTYPLSELAPNQEISAYVRVDRPMIALAPVSDSEPIDAEPLAGPPHEHAPMHVATAARPQMPHTASSVGTVGLLGAFYLALGLTLMALRMRRK